MPYTDILCIDLHRAQIICLESALPLDNFHPLIQKWFEGRYRAPTEAQRLGWAEIQKRNDALIAAPTGSGKTLTSFLTSIDRLLRLALSGELCNQTYVVYVSPLRALSNDIQRNLQEPLAEILELGRRSHPECPAIRADPICRCRWSGSMLSVRSGPLASASPPRRNQSTNWPASSSVRRRRC